jgi:hypothetical protein
MLSAMGAATGLVIYAALAAMRGSVAVEAPRPRREAAAPASVRTSPQAEPATIAAAD